MAQETYYAWSPIKVGGKYNEETQQVEDVKVINPGDAVTAADLEVDDEEFMEEYVRGGVVRPDAYPEDVPEQKSVNQHLRDQMQEAGEAFETTGGTLMLNEAEQALVARAAQKEVEDAEDVEDEESPDNADMLAHMPILADSGTVDQGQGQGQSASKPADKPASS